MDIDEINLLKQFNPGDEYTEKVKQAIENLLAEREQNKKKIGKGGQAMTEKIDEIAKKPLLVIRKFKELTDLMESMTKEEIDLLVCSLEYEKLHTKYPKYIKL